MMPKKLKNKKLKDLQNLDRTRTRNKNNSVISDIYKYYRKDLTGDHNVRYTR